MNSRKYQRRMMNWKMGRLTNWYQYPAGANTFSPAVTAAYHVSDWMARTPFSQKLAATKTRASNPSSITGEFLRRSADPITPSNFGSADGVMICRSTNCSIIIRILRWMVTSAPIRSGSVNSNRQCASTS